MSWQNCSCEPLLLLPRMLELTWKSLRKYECCKTSWSLSIWIYLQFFIMKLHGWYCYLTLFRTGNLFKLHLCLFLISKNFKLSIFFELYFCLVKAEFCLFWNHGIVLVIRHDLLDLSSRVQVAARGWGGIMGGWWSNHIV